MSTCFAERISSSDCPLMMRSSKEIFLNHSLVASKALSRYFFCFANSSLIISSVEGVPPPVKRLTIEFIEPRNRQNDWPRLVIRQSRFAY